MDLAHRDLPATETLFVSARVRSSLLASLGLPADALTGVRSEPGGPDVPLIEAAAPIEALRPGLRIVDTSERRKVYPGRHGLVPQVEREGLRLYLRPEDVPDGWPNPVWRVGNVEGLRWQIRGGQPNGLVADAFTVLGPIPAEMTLGSSGAVSAATLEAVGRLTTEQVRRFSFNVGHVDDPALPTHDLLGRTAGRLTWLAILALEKRAEEIDPQAGGEFYRGCYFVYELTDPHWLSAMRALTLAIRTMALADRMTSKQIETRMRPWRILLGEYPAESLPLSDDANLSVPPSAELIRQLVPWQERGASGRVWRVVTFPVRHPMWAVIPAVGVLLYVNFWILPLILAIVGIADALIRVGHRASQRERQARTSGSADS